MDKSLPKGRDTVFGLVVIVPAVLLYLAGAFLLLGQFADFLPTVRLSEVLVWMGVAAPLASNATVSEWLLDQPLGIYLMAAPLLWGVLSIKLFDALNGRT